MMPVLADGRDEGINGKKKGPPGRAGLGKGGNLILVPCYLFFFFAFFAAIVLLL